MELRRSKNVATYIVAPLVDADGDIVTGATGLDSELNYWDDGNAPQASFTDCTNEATEIGSTGIYYLSLTQAEMNHDYVYVIIKTSTSGAKSQHVLINCKNQPADILAISGDATAADNLESYCDGTTPIPANIAQISGDATAADNCELMFDGTGYAGGTTKLGVNIIAISDDTTAADNCERMFDGTGYVGGTALLAVNATQISGGTATTQIQTKCTDALNAYDPPTKAELDAADDAVLAAVAALNNLDAAGVRTALGLASANLDTQLGAIVSDTALIEKWILDKLVGTDNGDGTVTYVLYDTDDTTPLKTWVVTTATGTRAKAT